MKKHKIFQLILFVTAIFLIFFTYYNPMKIKNETVSKSIDSLDKEITSTTEDINTITEDVQYTGSDNKGTFFEINAGINKVLNNEPELNYMADVTAKIILKDGRIITITSDRGIYNKSTNDTQFMDNIKITEADNKITSDNLDLLMSKNLITIYNNVKYNGIQGLLLADKVDMNILKKETEIFMFNKEKKVEIQYNN